MRIYHFFSKNTRDNKDSRSRKDSNDNRNSIIGRKDGNDNRNSIMGRNRKLMIGVKATICFIILFIIIISIKNIIRDKKEDKTALTLKDNLQTEFLSDVKVSTFIEHLNGTLISDDKIDTTSLGTKTVKVNYKNTRGKKKHKSYQITIVDTEKPKIFLSSSTVSVQKGYNKNIINLFLSGDNCDSNPERQIIGNYDLNTPGTYDLTFEIKDASGNKESKNFKLKVNEISKNSSSTTTNNTTTTNKNNKQFSDIVEKYCQSDNKYTSAGIDVSSWQGDIDWKKVKEAGCDFAFIRVGYQNGRNGEISEDKYFKANIENAISNNIKVGIYFYSCAQTIEETQEQAKWTIEKIKPYNISLPVAFDWEEWNSFADYKLSFYGISKLADAFINVCKDNGYDGILYSSKNYLETIWHQELFPNIWLAQYANTATYNKSYNYWQMCNTGRIDGIKGDVDIDLAK